MTNKIAAALFLSIVAAIAFDVLAYDSEHLLFLARKFVRFIDWLAFWR